MIDISKINAELQRRHWSKATLSRLSGVSYSTILFLLNGKTGNSSFSTVVRVCKALDIPIEEVYQDANS